MAATIKLYTNHVCPCKSSSPPSPHNRQQLNNRWKQKTGAHRAHIALAELGISFEEEIIDLSVPRTAEYLAINPRGLVPSLSYNGQIITESAVVCQFLADAYPSHLVPTAGTPDAALQVGTTRVASCTELLGAGGRGNISLTLITARTHQLLCRHVLYKGQQPEHKGSLCKDGRRGGRGRGRIRQAACQGG